MRKESYFRTSAGKLSFEGKCAIVGAAVFTSGVAAMVTGAVKLDAQISQNRSERTEITRQIDSLGQNPDKNSPQYRDLANELYNQKGTADSPEWLLVLFGAGAFASGPLVAALPGIQVKHQMGL